MINLSQCSTMPFRHKAGDTFKLAFTFSYDVENVAFRLIITDQAGVELFNFPDTDWVRDGRKKTIIKTPAQFNLPKGKYNIKLIHTFPDSVVRTRFDSELTVF